MSGAHWFDGAVPILEYRRLPTASGVYAIADESLRSVYVGISRSIRGRLKDHINNLRRWEDLELHAAPVPFLNYNLGREEDLTGLDKAWHTYGPEALRVAVLEQGVPLVLLAEREEHWIRTLGRDHELLNVQTHSSYASNYDRRNVRGVTYLIYGSVRSETLPLKSDERDRGHGVGDIFARLDDGITGGGGGHTTFLAASALRTANWAGEFAIGATLTKGGTFTIYRTPEEMLAAFFTRRHRGSELVFRNLDYDMRCFLPALEQLANGGYETEIIVDGRGRFVYSKITRNGHTWYMRDLYALLPMPLEDLATLTGTEKPHEVARDSRFDPDKPEHISYLRHDLETLFAIYEEYTNTLQECYNKVNPSYSAGGTALKAFRRMITPREQRSEVKEYALKAYFGGLLFLIWVRSHKHMFKLDLDAACAIAMRKDREGDNVGCYGEGEYPDFPGIYLCEVSCSQDLPFPFVPARSDYDTIWPTRAFRTYLCSNTLALARTLGYSVDVVRGFTF